MDHLTLPGATFEGIEWFGELLEAGIFWHQCESIVKLILDISSLQVFQLPVQLVFNST
jgi:hypothetical protein